MSALAVELEAMNTTIYEVCRVVNYCPQDIGYDGYGDSRFFKVRY